MTEGRFQLLAQPNSTIQQWGDTADPNSLPGIPETARPWFMSVSLATRPRCFGCGGRMLPKTVRIQSNFALCEGCSAVNWTQQRRYWLALEELGCPLEISRSRGIVFWTPPVGLPDQDACIRSIELADIADRQSTFPGLSDVRDYLYDPSIESIEVTRHHRGGNTPTTYTDP